MKHRPLCFTCLVLFAILWIVTVLGGRYYLEEIRPSPVRDLAPIKGRVTVTGMVYDRKQNKDQQIFYLKNVRIKSKKFLLTEDKLILYCEDTITVKIHNQIEAKGNLTVFEEGRNPGNYDLRFHYAKMGVYGRLSSKQIRIVNNEYSSFKEGIYRFKQYVEKTLVARLGEANGQILNGILMGEKDEIDPEIKETYKLSGIGHILSISGLHISLIGLTLFTLIRRLTGSYPVAGVLGILFLLSYSLLIGFSVSIFRATVMFLFRVGAEITGRKYDSYTAVTVAALLTVLVNPFALLGSGFYLSYLAILGLILLYPLVADLPLAPLLPGVCAQVVLLGVLSYSFFEIPLYSVFLNLLIIPLLSVLVGLGFIGGLLGGIEIANAPCFFITGKVLDIYELLAQKSLEIPGARIINGQPNLALVAGYYLLLAILIGAGYKWKFKKRIRGLCLLTLLLLGSFGLGHHCHTEGLKMVFLDVGQGDGTLISTPNGTNILIDGGSTSVNELAKYRLEPSLKYYGIKELDYVFISHGDKDHYSGIQEMLERGKRSIPIKTLVFPEFIPPESELWEVKELAEDRDVVCLALKKGKQLETDGVRLTSLHPDQVYEDENAGSLVLFLEYGKRGVLFTGDVEGEGENALCDTIKSLGIEVDVLKTAHHGAKGGTSEAFLETIQPQLAIISAGANNSYGHPHDETLSRLEDRGILIRQTKEEGAILLDIAK